MGAGSTQSELPAQLQNQPVEIPRLVDHSEDVAIGPHQGGGVAVEERVRGALDHLQRLEADNAPAEAREKCA